MVNRGEESRGTAPKTALVFPGQGSQYVGMGKNLVDECPEAIQVFEEASSALGFDVAELCFNGPADRLNSTPNTQPAILTVTYALYRCILARVPDMRANAVCGHSLGEYSALVAAGAMKFQDAVRLVRRRGIIMSEAFPSGAGAMAAILGLDASQVVAACAESSGSGCGVVEPANFNCPGQVVISGAREAVEKAAGLALSRGAKRAVFLSVSGPFHSSLMKDAGDRLAPYLEAVEIQQPAVPFVANVTADFTSDPGQIRDLLRKQVSSPVRWWESISRLWERAGIRRFIEIGPGQVLSGLVRKIAPGAEIISIEPGKPLQKALEFLKGVL
ncbi:MAG: ACP S-malonyltransferase [Firmicutes bacterium]|nr:ACP S-malonyltransferase [Bacillota bacterium]